MDDWGIADGYLDVNGTWHVTSSETRELLRAQMGEPVPGRPIWFVQQGTEHDLWGPNHLTLESGEAVGVVDHLDASTPIGYHDLAPVDGGPVTRLVVHPRRCPEPVEAWGVAAQIYALWSSRSWGIGDLADLRELAERVVAAGGGALLTSPLHQPAPSFPQETSPYYPSSRRTLNPLLLAIDAPPPARLVCDPDRLIDRDDVWIAKRSVLEAEFEAALEAGHTAHTDPDSVAWWNARCDVLLSDWTRWPDPLPPVDHDLERRARFHQWVQGRLEAQLADVAATGVALIGDLAVGFSPSGADAYDYRHLLALEARIGAPPDRFQPAGQEWGLPPFVPWKLRAALYQPFIDTVRASLRGVRGLRIDHVMGLFRQYWVPVGRTPGDGAYVHFPADELLDIVCIEATRAGAFVIGEDLGTVEPGVRDALMQRGIAGTRVLWFESTPPADWPRESLGTITTHDLPTITQVFLGEGAEGSDQAVHSRLTAVAEGASDPAEAIRLAHRALLDGGSVIRLVTTDDLSGACEQPNHPGDTSKPNWRRRLPRPVDELLADHDPPGRH
ncbi:MAG: hypothetical protein RI958_2366 [Actinomycetota bacterium]